MILLFYRTFSGLTVFFYGYRYSDGKDSVDVV